MKRLFLLFITIGILLCGCKEADMDTANDKNKITSPITMLSNHTPYFANSEKYGYMTVNSLEYGYDFYGELIFRIDEQTKEMLPLCNTESCTHSSVECTAFLPGGQGGYSIAVHNGKIYCFVGGNSTNQAKIYSIDESTLDKTLVKEFDSSYTIDTGKPVFLQKDTIYYVAGWQDGQEYMQGIVRFDTVQQTMEVIYTTEMAIHEIGLDNGNLVFTANVRTTPEIHMFYLDLTNGRVTENTEYNYTDETLWSTTRGIISYDATNSAIYRYTDGEKQRVSQLVGDKVGYTGMYQRGVFGDMLVVDCFKTVVIQPGNYELISTKLALNLNNGGVNELQLKYKAGGLTEEVVIVGIMKDGFVVKYGEEYAQVMVKGQDGISRPVERTLTRVAYISADDFFNSRRNYIRLN